MTDTRTADKATEPVAADGAAEDPVAEPERGEPEPEPEPEAAAPEPRRLARDPLVRVALAITVAAAVVAAWFGWSYYSASGDDSLAYASERDRVLAAADQAIVNLNTLDHRNVAGGLKVWQDSATAQLYDSIVQGRAQLERDVAKARTTSTAKILESGLTELDTRAGKAAVAAAIRVTVTGPDGKPAARTSRLLGQLTKTSTGWKLSALGLAPTGTSGS